MSKAKTKYDEIIKVLQDLRKNNPTMDMARHVHTALADYGNFWGLSDAEFLFALNKYKTQMELYGGPIAPDDEVERIIAEGMDIGKLLGEEEVDDYEF